MTPTTWLSGRRHGPRPRSSSIVAGSTAWTWDDRRSDRRNPWDTTKDQPDFIPYPTNRVVGTVADATNAHAAINALLQAGFDRQDIDILHGDGDIQRLDPTGEQHGFLAQFQRTLLRLAGPAEDTRICGTTSKMFVRADSCSWSSPGNAMNACAPLTSWVAHGAEFIGFYGRWAWEGLTPDGGLSPAEPDRSTQATRPEQIPSLFAEAWNRRDPNPLSALFEDDAEFVNVTGLWWMTARPSAKRMRMDSSAFSMRRRCQTTKRA